MVNFKLLTEYGFVRALLDEPPIPPPTVFEPSPYRVPLSSATEAFDLWISKLLDLARSRVIFYPPRLTFSQRLSFFNVSSNISWLQRITLLVLFVLYEPLVPILLALTLFLAYVGKFLSVLGFPLPTFAILNWFVFKSFVVPNEVLPPGENGYTKSFNTAHTITLPDLRESLSSRNLETVSAKPESSVHTFALSYKHYPETTPATRTRTRLSEEDLVAIHQLLNSIGSCKVRFWIDTKLPPSDDHTFERWIDRGLRPYARYMTFICPSAIQYRSSSFWLANEYHFARATKGVLFFDSQSKLIFEYYSRDKGHADLRFFHILTDPHPHRDRFRQDDRAKFVRWSAAYLSTELGSKILDSPSIDTLVLPEDYAPELLRRIYSVVRVYGEQPLPVVHGKSWSPKNPLLLDEPSLAGFELDNWIALVNPASEEGMKVVYVMLSGNLSDLMQTRLVVLVMSLDEPLFHPLQSHVIGKVLCEVNREVLLNCTVVVMGSEGRISGAMRWK